MKILVINLLRLGDFLLSVPVINGLKAKYPGCRIDVLAHTNVNSLRPMLPQITRWNLIDREELQRGLGEAHVPLLTSFDILREQCAQLNEERYDLVVNLTHTEFSGWIAGYLHARSKIGLAFNSRGQAAFHSPWFRYLNQRATSAVDIVHYSEIFAYACELEGDLDWTMTPTSSGASEVTALGIPNGECIAVQALTSDNKKNWGETRWGQWLKAMVERRPGCHFALLGAPNEREALNRIRDIVGHPDRVSLAIVSMEGALTLLNRCELLVTGDTSIKHLANAASCAVVEISLGSSDFRRTGAYKTGSLILTHEIPCFPCVHSSPCSQPAQLCAIGLQVEDVVSAAQAMLDRNITLAPKSARETRRLSTGFWFAGKIADLDPVRTVDTWIERSSYKFILGGHVRASIPKFGSEVFGLNEEITRLVPKEGMTPLLAHLDFLDSELSERERAMGAKRWNFRPASEAKGMVDLGSLRATQNQIEDERREIEVKTKLIRSLKQKLAENP